MGFAALACSIVMLVLLLNTSAFSQPKGVRTEMATVPHPARATMSPAPASSSCRTAAAAAPIGASVELEILGPGEILAGPGRPGRRRRRRAAAGLAAAAAPIGASIELEILDPGEILARPG